MVTVIFKQKKKRKSLEDQEKKESKISANENKNITHKPGLWWVNKCWANQLTRKRAILQ